ncbi:MAG: phage holin family protein [Anaerolineae bacterium]|nr:phage holin family protein [Anaerolineae bacterium]
MNKLILRTAINALGLYAAVALVPGINPQNPDWTSYIWLALIFGLLNSLLRPLLKLLTCPLIILTLGIFTLVVNTAMFYLASYIGTQFNFGLTIDGFVPAFLGAFIVSVVSVILTFLLRDELSSKRRKRPKKK